jgi:hypothetical protein
VGGWNSHSQKCGLGVLRDSRKLKAWFQGSNTSHWGVLYTVGKFLKYRCPKWPRMSHLDICSLSYEQKKGRELNWQLDSRPLKVGNRPDLDVFRRSAIWHWKALQQDCFRPHPNQKSEHEVMDAQSPGSPTRDSFRTPPWESREKVPFGCNPHGELQKILYRGTWWLPPSPGRGESNESKVARG